MTSNLLSTSPVATGASYGAFADDEHAKLAVEQALSKMDVADIGSVILFLSAAYAHAPQEAIKVAAKTANTTQVFGCCALSLFTQSAWLENKDGAVAMVLPRSYAITPLSLSQQLKLDPALVFTLTTPNALNMAIGTCTKPQFGASCSDEFGHGPYSLWQSGQIVEREYTHMAFPNTLKTHTLLARGIKPVTDPMQVNLANSNQIQQVNQQPASRVVKQLKAKGHSNLLCARLRPSSMSDKRSLDQKTLDAMPLVSSNESGVIVNGQINAGQYVYWAERDPDFAAQEISQKLMALKATVQHKALFAFMFTNLSRGTHFYPDSQHQDIAAFRAYFPETPLLGFQSDSEIISLDGATSETNQYSSVICLFELH